MTETNATQAAELPVPDAIPESSPDAADTSVKSEPPKEADEVSEKVQKRISKLTGKWRQAQSEAEYWRERATRAAPPPVQAPQPAKKLADFNYDEEAYERDVQQRLDAVRNETRQRTEKDRAETTRKELLQKFWERAEDVRGDIEDFDDLVSSAPISDEVSDFVMHMDDGPHIALHLARNPSLAKSISNLPGQLAAARLIALSDRLATEREQAKAKPVSNAPPPPPRLEATEPAVERDPDKMSSKEWLKWRNKQLAKK